MLMVFLTVPDTNSLIVDTELTKIKVTVRINLKWPNLDYPAFYIVGRHLNFPVTTKRYISWVAFVFTIMRIGRLDYMLQDSLT
jgi:desulfoferrodoxin (superoxide reductase-like protein)